jgi:stage II sporulation protein AA (anti-sigma F factor antagonist)
MLEDSMQFETRKVQEGTVLTIRGRMDAVTAPEIEKGLSALIDSGEKKLIIDLKDLEHISSAGLRSLLVLAKRLKREEVGMLFANLQGHVMEVFRISGFYSLFTVCDSVDEALGRLRKTE